MLLDVGKIDKLPIIVVSTPRSGSSTLAHYIAELRGCRLFNEPTKTQIDLHKFFIHDAQNKNYVLKEHALILLKRYANICDQPSYKIRIRRRDIFKQVLSHYIASQRKKFLFSKNEPFVPDTIQLNEQVLVHYWNHIQDHNREAELFRYPIDLDLFYEDLEFPESAIVPTVAPLNNVELTEWAQTVLKDKL